MTLTVAGKRHAVARRSQVSIDVSAGKHAYVGAAPGIIPAIGTQTWEVGHEYTWRFRVVERSK
jgi:hypothetical protein